MRNLYTKLFITVLSLFVLTGCAGGSASSQEQPDSTLTASQNELISEGWYIPKTKPSGELSKEYGVKNKFGQQDNYFDIEIGKGCDVAIKIVDAATDQCIRYVFVPENSSINI